jgi:hypothetical protein
MVADVVKGYVVESRGENINDDGGSKDKIARR